MTWDVAGTAASLYSRKMYQEPANMESTAKELLPKDDVWFWNGRMGREEGDYGVGVGGGDGREKGRGVK